MREMKHQNKERLFGPIKKEKKKNQTDLNIEEKKLQGISNHTKHDLDRNTLSPRS